MTKEEIKSIIRHELLNIFTIINIFVSNGKSSSKNRKEMLHLIDVSSLLIAYENIFLGKKIPVHNDVFSLQDVVELLGYIYKKEFIAKKIKFSFNIGDGHGIKGDKRLFKESLELILKKIIRHTSVLNINYNKEKEKLIISYKHKEDLNLKKIDLAKSLLRKEYKTGSMGFQLALRLLDVQGIGTKIENDKITLQLK